MLFMSVFVNWNPDVDRIDGALSAANHQTLHQSSCKYTRSQTDWQAIPYSYRWELSGKSLPQPLKGAWPWRGSLSGRIFWEEHFEKSLFGRSLSAGLSIHSPLQGTLV